MRKNLKIKNFGLPPPAQLTKFSDLASGKKKISQPLRQLVNLEQ
ncbi:hypothetical protein STRCR_0290 [Streptococcus criceti HS-6]|uniref:Uncharacterized protein n=1 Tax=Streptococcus criceti HS-6 TaxID=873449 RepID=G5JP56_STRCG|nr:hypothetical protein STRCR_0290 [Streptococcus criceti HS-6]